MLRKHFKKTVSPIVFDLWFSGGMNAETGMKFSYEIDDSIINTPFLSEDS